MNLQGVQREWHASVGTGDGEGTVTHTLDDETFRRATLLREARKWRVELGDPDLPPNGVGPWTPETWVAFCRRLGVDAVIKA